MNFLRQSTANQIRTIGPFLDDTDYKTPETALTISNTDIKLIANGGTSVDKNSGGGTHRVNGMYSVTFNATDTATVGELTISVNVAGALPYFTKFYVLEEKVFDALFGSDATLQMELIDNAITSSKLASTALEVIADAVWDESAAGHVTSGTYGFYLDAAISSISGGGGDATEANQTTIISALGAIDTVVDAIKVVTDQFAFTSGKVNSHVISMGTNSLTADAAAADFIGASEIAASASQEIADLIAADWVAGDASPLAIISAFKADATLATMISRIDADISSITIPPTGDLNITFAIPGSNIIAVASGAKVYIKETGLLASLTASEDVTSIPIEVVIENPDKTDKHVIPDGSLTKVGTSVTFTLPNGLTDEVGTYSVAIRNATTQRLYGTSSISIDYAPHKDSL